MFRGSTFEGMPAIHCQPQTFCQFSAAHVGATHAPPDRLSSTSPPTHLCECQLATIYAARVRMQVRACLYEFVPWIRPSLDVYAYP